MLRKLMRQFKARLQAINREPTVHRSGCAAEVLRRVDQVHFGRGDGVLISGNVAILSSAQPW